MRIRNNQSSKELQQTRTYDFVGDGMYPYDFAGDGMYPYDFVGDGMYPVSTMQTKFVWKEMFKSGICLSLPPFW